MKISGKHGGMDEENVEKVFEEVSPSDGEADDWDKCNERTRFVSNIECLFL